MGGFLIYPAGHFGSNEVLQNNFLLTWVVFRNIFFGAFASLFILKAITIKKGFVRLNEMLGLKHMLLGLIIMQFSYALSGLIMDLINIFLIASKIGRG